MEIMQEELTTNRLSNKDLLVQVDELKTNLSLKNKDLESNKALIEEQKNLIAELQVDLEQWADTQTNHDQMIQNFKSQLDSMKQAQQQQILVKAS